MNKKISYILTFRIMIVLLGITLVFIPLFLYFQKSMFIDHEKRRMLSFAEGLSDIISDQDTEEMEEYIEDNEAEGYRVRIRNEAGDVIFNNEHHGEGSLRTGKEHDDGKEPAHLFKPDAYTEDALAVYDPEGRRTRGKHVIVLRKRIKTSNGLYFVYVGENMGVINEMFSYSNRILFAIIILFAIVCLTIMFGLTRIFLRPIEELSAVTQKLAGGDYSVRYTGPKTGNEIGILAENVNYMADSIQENITSLNNYTFLLNDRIDALKELEDLRKKMIAELTHELKTPLAIISSQVEMINTLEDGERKRQYYNNAIDEINKMSRIITDVLNNTAYEKDIIKGKPENTDLSVLIGQLAEKYRSYIEAHGLHFDSDLESSCMKHVYREHIEQVFNNYLTNALKNTQTGGHIRVALQKKDAAARLSVYNDGRQISDQDKDRIWLEYTTVSEPGSKDSSGLGLFIVKEISILYHTECGFMNHEGGVEFWFDFIDVV